MVFVGVRPIGYVTASQPHTPLIRQARATITTAMPLPAPPPLSSLHSLSSHHLCLPFLSFPTSAARRPLRRGDLAIRMGGGPRTYPGGVSKWQWKRMQSRKAKQLLKARLARERQLYEMRKRAELRDAVSHLERPWDPDAADSAAEAAPNLLSVAADDQLKVLADRFHRPGGVDLWNDRDGPQVFASPDTGRASARFFPKNAIHSVQPYALLGAGVEHAQDGSGDEERAQDGSGEDERAQGARENAAVEDVYGDREPTVQFMERDGMWEPVNALDGGDENNASYWSWNGDDDVISGAEDMGDVALGRDRRAMVRRDGRKGGVARWGVANAMAIGSDEDRDWRGHGFLSDSEGTGEGHLEQRWSERSSGSRRKRPSGRGKAGSNAIGKDRMGGVSSFSDSEVIGGGFELKRRARNRVSTMNGAGRWNTSYDGNGNVIRKEWIEDEFDSNSDSGRDVKLEQKWKTRNRFNRSENQRGQPGLEYDNANANNGDRSRRYTRGNNGDGRDWFGNGFAFLSDSEGVGEGHLEQRWSNRSSGSRRKRPSGRGKADSNAIGKDRMGGVSSFSDSEVIGGGFEPKRRARNRVSTMNSEGRWKTSYDGNGNVIRKEWIKDEFDSNSDSGRDFKLEQKWKTRNRFNRSENRRGQPGLEYDNANANIGDRPRRYTRGNNGDRRDWFGNGFASDLEGPTWKPRRNGARKSSSHRGYSDDTSGKFGRGGNGSARSLEANPMNTYRENDSEGGKHMMSKNRGRRFSGDGYSLRPTSELHSSDREKE